MHDLAVTFRAAQLYTHSAHLLAKGATSHQDHKLFGDFYSAHESAFDQVMERMIGLGHEIDLQSIISSASRMAAAYSFVNFTNETGFRAVEEFEQQIRELVRKYVPNVDDGTQNLLQGLADESLARSYHIKQRLS